uniref:Cyclic nucleotide-binding domain-containing protein n=2 Tax=Chaetoceros debilis TaxID=122233 RepID=A0A7S3Q478_9STRA|mmetsp:Transcript_6736/g.9916  ORF Transcript_6736/g.9916 Transcript_6736/m.9916 type:complete len:1438 (+) Transcript_6736:166-4479(+)|eukprot:CAMPEP_0194103562 /NCGR_PEP_ID=MMETSP0150-20130528/3992_1 /TAXON_ID=122233 /ORGANISM="Chaetoceros debilis, Strain MM31A-1" /LENGTH=1437 /DNA_ID=CAMNT_0038790835 /DNA_START=113 /DNA_END=4423 /DNA_ORIENTATION=+
MPLRNNSPPHNQSKEKERQGDRSSGTGTDTSHAPAKVRPTGRSFGSCLQEVRKKLKIRRRKGKGKRSLPFSIADPEHLHLDSIRTTGSQQSQSKSANNIVLGKSTDHSTKSLELEQPSQLGHTTTASTTTTTAASQKVQGPPASAPSPALATSRPTCTSSGSSNKRAAKVQQQLPQQKASTSTEAAKKTFRPRIPSPSPNRNRGIVTATGKYSAAAISHRPINININTGNKKSASAAKDNNNIMEDSIVGRMYDSIPLLEATKLPRGGISIETEAVGRVQFGIPPETIKDSMCMGIDVPLFYIVPVEPFCREMGPALGVNLAEFEFPAYFNFFIKKKRCILIVDSADAEDNIRRVFSETLLGPAQFRNKDKPISHEPADFAPDFPRDAIPDFSKELKNFRVMPNGEELELETLLSFSHFVSPVDSKGHEHLGVPPSDEGNKHDEVVDNDDEDLKSKVSVLSRVKLCEVAVLYPPDATPEEISGKTCKRVEIFKMPGGAEYILHDIDEDNIIIGKGRFSGNLRVSASMGVHGFNGEEEEEKSGSIMKKSSFGAAIPRNISPPSFHPPSFGVTVLGNSHGFDKTGSTSGYVLWINGRGVMIDPPPYSSATLEREGIRPRTIVGIILTHCHADHDAGAFQKVLTGSPVVVITTPTIYNSFIRKYAALSALSPALLRHSHRHKPAIIGKPLRFQGATFHFTYTLHSIPCVGFRVDWRGRSMVFTGDHFNSPEGIDKLQQEGVLSAARAQDLRDLPLQETDLLLHEAGVPPLHTPLEVLMALPKRVKDRLYVVHTQKLPDGCELRVAPTGTAGTIRLDEKDPSTSRAAKLGIPSPLLEETSYDDENMFQQSMWMSNEYDTFGDSSASNSLGSSIFPAGNSSLPRNDGMMTPRFSINAATFGRDVPRVALRPTSSTDAWFILNLLSAVPFLSGLSYASTMEVLETARVDAFSMNDIVVPASNRSEVLCVVWEGTCMERKKSLGRYEEEDETSKTVWHAGDWTGPISLQPEKELSGESESSSTHDIVAMSQQGVKVITVEYANLHTILKSGSSLYRTYLDRKAKKYSGTPQFLQDTPSGHLFVDIVRKLEIMDVIKYNTTLRKMSAVQQRHLESLAEGPVYYAPGERLWRSGAPVDKAFIIVGGTVSFLAKRRNGGSVGVRMQRADEDENTNSLGERMRRDAEKVQADFDNKGQEEDVKSVESDSSFSSHEPEGDFETMTEKSVGSNGANNFSDNHDYTKLSDCLQKRAETLISSVAPEDLPMMRTSGTRRPSDSTDRSELSDSISGYDEMFFEFESSEKTRNLSFERRRSSIDRYANKQLVRLYNRRAFTAGLVFSTGHFLGDISKMVRGLLSSDYENDTHYDDDDNFGKYGFGEKNEGNNSRKFVDMTIHEQEGDQPIVHSSTLAAGKDGCVVLVFAKSSITPFFDEHPGLLLSLLGTQVVL